MTSTQTVDAKAVSRALTNATTAASHAPSIHGTRPWRWRAHGDHLGLSVLPLSSTIEVTATREIVRHLLPGPGYPYLVLRFGVLDSAASGPPRTPRLPAEQIVAQP